MEWNHIKSLRMTSGFKDSLIRVSNTLEILEIYWNYFFLLGIYWKFTKSPGNFLV